MICNSCLVDPCEPDRDMCSDCIEIEEAGLDAEVLNMLPDDLSDAAFWAMYLEMTGELEDDE